MPPYGINASGGPSLSPEDEANVNAQRYSAYEGDVLKMWQAESGFNKLKLEAQLEDASKARQNAMQIAALQSKTTRYGIDAQTQNMLTELKEKQRQFDLSHALDMQKLGLSYAETATEYLSTPDRFFQASDFMGMANRALGRQGGPTPYGSNMQPVPKTEADFAALAGYTMPGAGGAGQAASTPAQTASYGGGGGGGGGYPTAAEGAAQRSQNAAGAWAGATGNPNPTTQSAGTAPGGADPRVQAINSVVKALPPSEQMGMSGNDYAVLSAVGNILSTNLQPGTVERMRPGQQKILMSGAKRLGYDPADWMANYQRYGVGQGSARRA